MRSSEGFTVETVGRMGIRYTEPGKDFVIDAEGLAIPGFGIYPSSIPGDEAEKDRIVDNVRRALASMGLVLQ